MFDELFRLLPSRPAILEVGPGTGQATRDLLSRGATVHAIEIGPAMAVLRDDPRFSNVEVRAYDWNQTYSAADYRKLMLSYSGTQMMTPSARQGLLDDMENFVRQRFGNQVTRPIVVTLTTARLRLSTASQPRDDNDHHGAADH